MASGLLRAIAAATVLVLPLSAHGQSASPISNMLGALAGGVPPGWSRNMDGSYKQAQSGVLCPTVFKSFTFEKVQGPIPNRPNVLGTCYYRAGESRIGTIRIRRYGGDSENGPLAANDKLLMAGGSSAPPMLLHTGIDRRDGGGRATATVIRNGLLVDCSVWQPEHTVPRSDFPLYCTTLTGS